MSNVLLINDQQQREQALNPKQSFIVQAPAGSGKTELLIQRFLLLLNQVSMPEEILAITFTKKAANEMRARVIHALLNACHEPKPSATHQQKTWELAQQILQRDKKLNWNLLQNPNRLRIQTIDALCTYLTKQLPLLAHFGGSPTIADYPHVLYREAVQEILMHVEENLPWSQAISQLLFHLDNDLNKLHDLLVSLLAKRDQWLPYIQLTIDPDKIRKQLEEHLALTIIDCLESARKKIPATLALELIAMIRFAASQLRISQPDADIVACLDMMELPTATIQEQEKWVGLAKLLLTDEGSWRKTFTTNQGFPAESSTKNKNEKLIYKEYKQRMVLLMETLQNHDDIRQALNEILLLPKPAYPDQQWEALQALLQVLKIAAAQLRVTFKQHGQIDFIENAQAAITALGQDEQPTDLALALDYKIQHILVDEFQDTSFTQYQLLEKLTLGWEPQDGRTLFIVGDPMQSIYRFREAEVGLFLRMQKNGIGNLRPTPLTLTINFRSTTKIVEWINTHFQAIFPKHNDMIAGAVTYSKSIAQQTDNQSSEIDIKGFVTANDNNQNQHILELIINLQHCYPQDKIAILVRSRGHLTSLINLLKKEKISYHAIDIDPLSSRQAIQDLLALTCALLHPYDRISWLAILRAPWCGLTLQDLLVISGENAYQTIYERLENPTVQAALSRTGKNRLAKVFPILKDKILQRGRHPLREWIENTWIALGGPACLQHHADIDDVNAFFGLLEKCDDQQTINIDQLKERTQYLYAATQNEHANLQIMTIHTSKGLEFDTVILPHLERKIPHDDKALFSWMEQPLTNNHIALLMAPIHAIGNDQDKLYNYIQRKQKLKLEHESDRLFYVAATRAKKRLYLYFNAQQDQKDEIKIQSGSFLKKIWPFIRTKQKKLLSVEKENTSIQEERKKRFLIRLTQNWHASKVARLSMVG